MKVLISYTENPFFLIKILDELEFFIDKKMIFDENKISVGPPRPPSPIVFQAPGKIPSGSPDTNF
jgi:hypothetical protein